MVNILPGEPVPPGFEDEIHRASNLQQIIDSHKNVALIGLGYTIELQSDNEECKCFCVLCNKNLGVNNAIAHWTSFNHCMKYLERHYPTAVKALSTARQMPSSQNLIANILKRLAAEIEEHYGRMLPLTLSAMEYQRCKPKYHSEVNSRRHFDEYVGPNFVEVVDQAFAEFGRNKEERNNNPQITIKVPERINNEFELASARTHDDHPIDLDEISSDSDSDQPDRKKRKKHEQQPAYRVLPRINRSPPFDEINEKSPLNKAAEKKQLPTPKELSLQASHIAQERYKWEKYHCMVQIHLKQMRKQQEEYDKNPEKHPDYPGEWKKFWNRRYKELQAEKKVDPNKYDYKPEWITYWKGRMIELFNTLVDKRKMEIKLKLDIREDEEEQITYLKEKYKVAVPGSPTLLGPGGSNTRNQRGHNSPSNGRRNNRSVAENGDVINISDDELSLRHYGSRRLERRHHSRSSTPTRRSRSRRRSRSFSMSPPPSLRHEYRRRHQPSCSRSRSPFDRDREHDRRHSRSRQISLERHGRHHDDYRGELHSSERDRDRDRERERNRDRDYYCGPPYSRSSRIYGSTESGEHYRVMNAHGFPEYTASNRSLSPKTSTSKANSKANIGVEPEVDDGPLTIVGVLRMLSAVEEHLGSLGPKTLDLLGKALAMEKVKANAADDLLLNDDYCVFLETIKEKLKGLLIADVLEEPQKVRVVKKVITNIAALIHQVNSKAKGKNTNGKTNDGQNNSERNKQITKRPSLPLDRALVVTRMAAALVNRGCETITTPDMDKLLDFFILIAKIKRKFLNDGMQFNQNDLYRSLGIHRSTKQTSMLSATKVPTPFLDEELEREVTELVNEATRSTPTIETVNKKKSCSTGGSGEATNMGSLTDSELKLLLKNFKSLSNEEQDHLIGHLKQMEKDEPHRAENLRKYVDVTDLDERNSAYGSILVRVTYGNKTAAGNEYAADNGPSTSGRQVPKGHQQLVNNSRESNGNNSNPNKFTLDDDDDDDYNFDEVFTRKLVSKSRSKSPSMSNSKPKPSMPADTALTALTFKPAERSKTSINDTENLIANLMGSLQQNAVASAKLSSNSSVDLERVPVAGSSGQNVSAGIQLQSNQKTPERSQHRAKQVQQLHQQPQQQQIHFMQQQQQQQQPPGASRLPMHYMSSGNNMQSCYQQSSQQYPIVGCGTGSTSSPGPGQLSPMGRYPQQQGGQPNANMPYNNPMYNYSNHIGANYAHYPPSAAQHQQSGQWPQAVNGPPSAQYFAMQQQQQQQQQQLPYTMYGSPAGGN